MGTQIINPYEDGLIVTPHAGIAIFIIQYQYYIYNFIYVYDISYIIYYIYNFIYSKFTAMANIMRLIRLRLDVILGAKLDYTGACFPRSQICYHY